MQVKKIGIAIAVIGVLSSAVIVFGARYFAGERDKETELPNAIAELKKISTVITGNDSLFVIGGNISITDSEDGNKVKETSSFLNARNGNRFYAMLSSQETISDGNITVQLDTIAKYIIISKADKSVLENMKNVIPVIDSLLSDTATIKAAISGAKSNRMISYTNAVMPNVKESRLVYNSENYDIQYAEIDWWKHPEMVNTSGVWTAHITYKKLSPEAVNILNKMKEVILYKNNKPVVTEKYKYYTVKSSI